MNLTMFSSARLPLVLAAALAPLVAGCLPSDVSAADDGGGDAPTADAGPATIQRYEGTISFVNEDALGVFDGSMTVSASLKEHRANDLDKYEGSGQAKLTYTYRTPLWTCEPVEFTIPTQTVLQVYGGSGSIRGASDPFQSKVQFAVTGNLTGEASCCLISDPKVCKKQPFAAGLFVHDGCAPADLGSYGSRELLEGSGSFVCGGKKSKSTWTLTAVSK